MNYTEILAPAGSYEAMTGAFNAGADAVYAGGNMFGARAYAHNFDKENLIKAIEYTHLHDKKLYLTVNTLLKDQEIDSLYDYLAPLYEAGLHAVIVQDLGVLDFIRQTFPGLDIHASTQMTIVGQDAACFLKDYGVSRIVPARELGLSEIACLKQASGLEVETFVHGALCYCYSGQCFFSSILGGRSGNRGRCAQPCRLPYTTVRDGRLSKSGPKYYMSLKDISTLEYIPDLVEAGIDSFKIEGRMKSPEYAAFVSYLYKKYLDLYLDKGRAGFHIANEDMNDLNALYNRGGSSAGYYKQHNSAEMVSLTKSTYKSDNEQLMNSIKDKYLRTEIKEKIKGTLTVLKGLPATMQIEYNDFKLEVKGDMVTAAMNQPLTREALLARMNKTGNTPFVFKELKINMEEDAYLRIQSLNQLRRDSLLLLEKKLLAGAGRDFVKAPVIVRDNGAPPNRPCLNIALNRLDILPEVLEIQEVSGIYLELSLILEGNAEEIFGQIHAHHKKVYAALPYIVREETRLILESHKELLCSRGIDGFLVRNIESYSFIINSGIRADIITDYNVYTFNQQARSFWLNQPGVNCLSAPVELNYKELRRLGCETSEVAAYGYLPLMITSQCIHKTSGKCFKQNDGNKPELRLSDRYNKQFKVESDCRYCYNLIYNSQPLMLLDHVDELRKLNPKALRLIFTDEKPTAAVRIIKAFVNNYIYHQNEKNFLTEFTKGHFKRGVE